MADEQPKSVADFAAAIKAKYPEYKDAPDDKLARAMVAKYPEYRGRVQFGPIVPTESQALAKPPVAPTNQSVVQPVEPSPYKEAIGKARNKFLDTTTVGKKLDKTMAPVNKFLAKPDVQMAGSVMAGGAPAAEDMAVKAMQELAQLGTDFKGAMPAAKAAENFQKVHMAARDLPVDTTQAVKLAKIAAKEEEFGGKPPAVITEFLKKVGDGSPITYADARKFYSNASRLSDEELGSTNAVMRRHMVRFAKALGQGIENTTESIGMLDDYKAAMKNYRIAKRIQETTDYIKKNAVKGAITGAIGAAGYGAYKAATK